MFGRAPVGNGQKMEEGRKWENLLHLKRAYNLNEKKGTSHGALDGWHFIPFDHSIRSTDAIAAKKSLALFFKKDRGLQAELGRRTNIYKMRRKNEKQKF